MSEVKVNKITPRTDCGTTQLGDSGDTVTVTGDLRSDSLKAADGGVIISQSGTTITLGASGDTVSLASGASQTGFGRTGTVNWDTTPKTSTVTAESGVGYFVDTSSGSVTVNLPAGSAGAIVAIADYANTADTNKIVIAANGSNKIQGVSGNNFEITVEGGSVTLVFVDSVQGWRPTDASTASSITENNTFISATGGTVTTVCTNFKVHTFTSPGTFCVSAAGGPVAKADYMVIAGGGGGGPDHGGAGGAGGYRESHCTTTSGPYTASPLASSTSLPITVQGYPITVGGGGTGGSTTADCAARGSSSVFSSITSTGGGGIKTASAPLTEGPMPGGSGSGASGQGNSPGTGGVGNTPPVSPPQGNSGGASQASPSHGGSGGGGAGGAGQNGGSPQRQGGSGGAGTLTHINGSPVTRASGGSGGTSTPGSPQPATTGGGGAGGAGPTQAGNGTANTGGGGGGGTGNASPFGGGNGGSGVVIIRYKFQ